MGLVLHFRGTLVFEVLAVEEGGATLILGALWDSPEVRGVRSAMSKAALRNIGYTPMEVDDAIIAKLRPKLRPREENL